MEKFIYKLDQNDKTILSNLIIKEYCPVQDNNGNKLLSQQFKNIRQYMTQCSTQDFKIQSFFSKIIWKTDINAATNSLYINIILYEDILNCIGLLKEMMTHVIERSIGLVNIYPMIENDLKTIYDAEFKTNRQSYSSSYYDRYQRGGSKKYKFKRVIKNSFKKSKFRKTMKH